MALPVKHRGRPTKAAKRGKRQTVSLRLTAEIKTKLDAAAKANDRPFSQEAELRLEQSFRLQEEFLPLAQVLELKYGRQLAGLLMILGLVMKDVGRHSAFAKSMFDPPAEHARNILERVE